MQQCPSCQHELTMKEQIEQTNSCPACGIYFEKFLAKQAALKEAALSEEGRTGGMAGARAAVRQARSKREMEERANEASKSRPSHVSIVDFDLPFWSLVVFLVKLTFAAIPAAIIVALLVTGAGAVLSLLGHILG